MSKSEQWKKFKGDDIDFYVEVLSNESLEVQCEFWRENPDFLEGLPIQIEHIHLLQDESYRRILKGIAKKQKERKTEQGKANRDWSDPISICIY